MAGAIDTVTVSLASTFRLQATEAITGNGAPAISQNILASTTSTFTTGTTAASTANQVRRWVQSVTMNSNVTVDLSAAFTNVMGVPTATFARIKAYRFKLMTDGELDADGTAIGTAATQVKIGGAASNGHPLWLDSQTDVIVLNNGAVVMHADLNGTGVVVDSTHKNLYIVNSDTDTDAKVMIELIGADA